MNNLNILLQSLSLSLLNIIIINILMNILPLPYSIPEEIFNNNIKKKNNIAKLIPGKLSTYIYDTEESYYNMYGEAKIGYTFKKYGWDCLRHYEILANNCIPLFKNLDKCPELTMNTFPKKLVIECNKKINNRRFGEESYKKYSSEIFNYSKNNLTCKKSAQYFLGSIKKISKCEKEIDQLNILMLCGSIGYRNVNYSRDLLSIGLRRILNEKFVDYPKNKVLYKGCKKLYKYNGKGFTYGNRLENIEIDRDNIEDRIKNKEFDFIVYGRVGNKDGSIQKFKDLIYWKHVKNYYDKNNIVFIYGGDIARSKNDDCLKMHIKNGICFVRELE